MGGTVSCLPRYGCCVPRSHPNACKENHTSTPRGKKVAGHRRNLSAAFNMADLDTELNMDLLNVNTATEEELMTLPGVNRQTAHNIVEYRRQIGGFKKVEDLALVSGVGANKLTQLRLEICVRKAAKSSNSSSPSSSRQDLSLQDNVSRSSSKSQRCAAPAVVSVNSSNVFQLMRVKGISQGLAENIVMYREKRGPFASVDDLLRVKGIKPYLLSVIRPNLTTEEVDGRAGGDNVSNVAEHHPLLQQQGSSSSQEDMISLYGPLARKSYRGPRRKLYFNKRNSRPVMRVATWNLAQCSEDKAINPGVKEVIAMTALENGLAVIAVQELGDAEALEKLCDELNRPTIPSVKKCASNRAAWRCVTSPPTHRLLQSGGGERLGFLYDAGRGVELLSSSLLPQPAQPFLALFRLGQLEVSLVNVHLAAAAELDDLMAAADARLQDDSLVIVLGDFNRPPNAEEFSSLLQRGYQNSIPADKYTNISTRNPEGSWCHDNLWIGPHSQRHLTGTADVVREGLTSPWIPDGWGWGGVATDHCPAWAELYVDGPLPEESAEEEPALSAVVKSAESVSMAAGAVKDIHMALRMGVAGAEL